MPYIHSVTTVTIPKETRETMAQKIVDAVVEITGKPRQWTMVRLEDGADIWLQERGSAAYVEVRLVGQLAADVKQRLTKAICDLHKEQLNLDPARIYVVFDEIKGESWGWNGQTFA